MSDKQTSLGVIRSEDIYPLTVFYKLSGLGAHAVRQARRNGLRVREVGNRSYILGNDFYQFLGGQPQEDDMHDDT